MVEEMKVMMLADKNKNINKKGNKKGQFFSLGTFLLLVVLVLIFSYSAINRKNTEDFQVQRLKTAVMSNFVDEFEKEYAYKILETAAKPSMSAYLEDYSNPMSFDDFTTIMKTGRFGDHSFPALASLTTNSTLKRVLSTVTFNTGIRSEFDYTLDEAQMIAPDKMKLSFTFRYSFTSDKSTWNNSNIKVDMIMDVYSLNHPVYRQIIGDYWVQDTGGTCLARQIFTNGDNCIFNLKPFVEPAPV
jgi:ribosomal protein L31